MTLAGRRLDSSVARLDFDWTPAQLRRVFDPASSTLRLNCDVSSSRMKADSTSGRLCSTATRLAGDSGCAGDLTATLSRLRLDFNSTPAPWNAAGLQHEWQATCCRLPRVTVNTQSSRCPPQRRDPATMSPVAVAPESISSPVAVKSKSARRCVPRESAGSHSPVDVNLQQG